jgi:hypothetical protein
MDIEQEKNFHLNQCEQCFQNAWTIIIDIIEVQISISKNPSYKNKLISPAFRFALIEYDKSYTQSRGKHGRYILPETHVPPQFYELHQKIIDSRHQKHAHHDLNVLDADPVDSYKHIYIMSNHVPTELISEIQSIKTLLEMSINNMHEEYPAIFS